MFTVVEFKSSRCGQREVAVVPTTWLANEDNSCAWPPAGVGNITGLIKKSEVPGRNWPQHDVRVLGKANSYTRAHEKLKKSEETSDLDTENEVTLLSKRRRIPSRKVLPSVSSESEEEQEDSFDELFPAVMPSPVPSSQLGGGADPSTGSIGVIGTHQHGKREEKTYSVSQKVMRQLLEMVVEIREDTKYLKKIAKGGGGFKDISPPILPSTMSFPLQTISDFDRMELWLNENADEKNKLIGHLADRGGDTFEEFIKRGMGFLLNNDLALLINMTGRNGKKAFLPSTLFDVVYGATKKNPITGEKNKRDVERTVGRWLIGARDRGGGRAQRAEKEKKHKHNDKLA